MDFESEEAWLHHHVMLLRMLLRYTRAKQAETLFKDLIRDAETRLETLEDRLIKNPN